MYERISSNVRRSWALIIVFVLLVSAIGWFFGLYTDTGFWPLGIAVGIAIAMSWGSYFASDRIALSMSRAQPADPQEYPQLHNIVEGLSIAAGIPKPRVFVVQDDAPNAFATGRNPEHAAVAVTTGLLAKMKRDELEGVIAHELSHVQNRDTLVMTLAVTLVGVVVLLADFFLRAMWWGGGSNRDDRGGGLGAPIALLGIGLMILAPFFAQMLKFAISRQREFLADADAINFTRYPPGLINALQKLRDDQTVVRTASKATAHLWIESPIARAANEGPKGRRSNKSGAWLNRMFDTHPPLDDRIEALQTLGFGAVQPTATAPQPPA
ncbi:MAG: M48 family metallopeptidase [Actinomycetota bacterium]|nr:M48 family metallopeptidase [Actinomycetota bacterium]